ncbi:hypothetical protein ABID21_004202 [Pseudorhizobium tarimense]|uniref:Uncharacterized protein n=1 Tax=Pseudorhizobium tarimense TaxID=1079109 RepID=A0ABV2HC77_9HYPH|nr:hypothetical protein [Pseudorhizobium tarimense]MCJ8521159.1 hypothetical protein [Pseudorhizobium tarimense]
MLRSDLGAGSEIFDHDVQAIAASLNDVAPVEAGAGLLSGQPDALENRPPVILHRRASHGLQSRLSDERKPWPVDGEYGRRVIEQRLDRLDARLDDIARSVEFSEAFLSLKLKQQLEETMVMAAAATGGGRTSASRGGLGFAILLVCTVGLAALLGAEVYGDATSQAAGWATERLAPLFALVWQSLTG